LISPASSETAIC